MKKKNFKGGIDGLLGIEESHSESFDRKKPKVLEEPYVPATFRIRESTMDYVRRICHWDRLEITPAVNKILKDYVLEYIKRNGELQPVPPKNQIMGVKDASKR